MSRSSAVKHIAIEWVLCRGGSRGSQMPLSGSRQWRQTNRPNPRSIAWVSRSNRIPRRATCVTASTTSP